MDIHRGPIVNGPIVIEHTVSGPTVEGPIMSHLIVSISTDEDRRHNVLVEYRFITRLSHTISMPSIGSLAFRYTPLGLDLGYYS